MQTFTAAPPAQGHNSRLSRAYAVFVLCGILAAAFPGALLGAAIAYLVWRASKTDTLSRWLIAALSGAAALLLQARDMLDWTWSVLGHIVAPQLAGDSAIAPILPYLPPEMLVGPLLLVGLQFGAAARRQTIHGEEWLRFNKAQQRKQALGRHLFVTGTPSASQMAHSPGKIRLGISMDDERLFDLSLEDISQHIFIPGASGSGKTTTLVRLADGALANGCGVVIIDCKGVGLGGVARSLATNHDVPFTIVDPHDPRTVGYDPCTGDAATIANKLIGAFSFSDEAEIYKHVAMEVIPVICRAMLASGIDITLAAIYEALARGGLARLARRSGAELYRDRLQALEDAGGLGTAGYVGLQKRFGALMEGSFGELFHKRPSLDWMAEMRGPGVTYLSLSSTAASEDVELFGRVIAQDLKQVCHQRMLAIERGDDPIAVLVIFDEFAALREAQQVVDLLLQARQARLSLVVATQYLPEDPAIRKPVLSAATLIAHRVEAEDAELIAAQFGTHTTTAMTAQVDYDQGLSQKGSVRWVEEYNLHPNDLKSLPVGVAAIYARRTKRQSLVRVHRTV